MDPCPICHKEYPSKLCNINSFDVYKCINCELIWVPDVDGATLNKFYTKDYFKNPDSKFGYNDYIEDEKTLRINARYILSKVPARKGRLLDIGCAFGFLLDEARKLGWETHGVELNKEAAYYAAHHLNLNIFQGPISQANFLDSSFDCITIIGTMEHFQDPVSVIQKANKLLKPGGYLIITTISTKGLIRLYAIKPPEHLYYFSPQNISLLLKSSGFNVLKRGGYWCHYQLSEALCRAYRLIFKSEKRLENFLGLIPFLRVNIRVPTNEMFVLSQKIKHHFENIS